MRELFIQLHVLNRTYKSQIQLCGQEEIARKAADNTNNEVDINDNRKNQFNAKDNNGNDGNDDNDGYDKECEDLIDEAVINDTVIHENKETSTNESLRSIGYNSADADDEESLDGENEAREQDICTKGNSITNTTADSVDDNLETPYAMNFPKSPCASKNKNTRSRESSESDSNSEFVSPTADTSDDDSILGPKRQKNKNNNV